MDDRGARGQYQWAMAASSVIGSNVVMTRRIAALGLWAYFGWYLAAHVTALLGLPASLAPLGGVLIAAVALVDWRRLADGQAGRMRPVSSP